MKAYIHSNGTKFLHLNTLSAGASPNLVTKRVSFFFQLALLPVIVLALFAPNVTAQHITIENGGMRIELGAGIKADGILRVDSNTVFESFGEVQTGITQTSGKIELMGDNAVFVVDSALFLEKGLFLLNSNSIILRDRDTFALNVDNGILLGENHLAQGSVKWYAENNTGSFNFPFRNDSLNDVSVQVDVLSAGTVSSHGVLSVTTYPTHIDNTPYPNDAIELTDASFNDIAELVVNRFWEIELTGYSVKPHFDLILKYDHPDLLYNYLGTLIDETKLKAQFWNGSNWEAVTGNVDTAANTVTITNIDKSGTWALVDSDHPLYMPTKATAKTFDLEPGQSNTGMITLTPSGGKPPYHYRWFDNDTSNTKTGLAVGTYSVSVIDNANDTVAKDIWIGYQIAWADTVGVDVTGNSAEKLSTTDDVDARAFSSNTLSPEQDGFIEFTGTTEGNEEYFIGLSSQDNSDIESMEYSFEVRNSYIYINESGVQIGNYGQHLEKVFRIERDGDTIRYFSNATEIRRVAANRSTSLTLGLGLGRGKPLVDSLRASFDVPFGMRIQVTDVAFGDESGEITLHVYGGETPYTATWADGPTGLTRDSLAAGTYNVTVVDDNNDSLQATVELGFGIVWQDTVDVSISGNSISKSSTTSTYDAGASSVNYLRPGEDGWAEFTLSDALDRRYYFGLSERDLDVTEQTLEFAFLRSADSIHIVESGRFRQSIGPIARGDRFRLGRENDSIRYYRNGELLRSTWTDTTERLLLDISLGANEPTISNIKTSFGIPFGVNAVVTDAWPGQQSSGNITLQVLGGVAPYSYIWSNGDTNAISDSLYAGVYTVTVTDDNADTVTAEIEVGFKISWNNIENVIFTQNSITKADSSEEWDAGASSLNFLAANEEGYVEFTVTNTADHNFLIGLTQIDTTLNPDGTNYALEINNGRLLVKENGIEKEDAGEVSIGDVIRVEKTEPFDTIRYSKNGTEITSAGYFAARVYAIDVSLGKGNPGIQHIKTNLEDVTNPNAHYYVTRVTGTNRWFNAGNWSYYSGGAGGAGVPDSTIIAVLDSNGGTCCNSSGTTTAQAKTLIISNATVANMQIIDIKEDLIISNSTFQTSYSAGAGPTTAITVGGDFKVIESTFNLTVMGRHIEVGGDLIQKGGYFRCGNSFSNKQLTVGGNIHLEGDSFQMPDHGIVNAYGNFTDSTGHIRWRDTELRLYGNDVSIYTPDTLYNLEISDSQRVTFNSDILIENEFEMNDATVEMNGHSLILLNGDSTALLYNDGRLMTNDDAEFSNKVIWMTKDNTGTYKVPFYSGNQDLTIEMEIIASGDTIGALEFSTYVTDSASIPVNNRPYPTGLSNYFDTLSQDNSLYMVDRFWLVDTIDYAYPPLHKTTLKYLDSEAKGSNKLQEADLFLTSWNGVSWDTIIGTGSISLNNYAADTSDDYGIWTLSDTSAPYATGITCAQAIELDDTLWYTMYDTVMWLTFTAEDTSYSFLPESFKKTTNDPFTTQCVYYATCDSMIWEKSVDELEVLACGVIDDFTLSTDSGTTYLVKIKQTEDNTSTFQFRSNKRNYAPCPDGIHCNLAYYGDFENLGYNNGASPGLNPGVEKFETYTNFVTGKHNVTQSQNTPDWFQRSIYANNDVIVEYISAIFPHASGAFASPILEDFYYTGFVCDPVLYHLTQPDPVYFLPDPHPTDGGDSYVGLASANIDISISEGLGNGVYIELCEPMQTGGTNYSISFLATSYCSHELSVFLSTAPPCPKGGPQNSWADCISDGIFSPDIIEAIPVTNPNGYSNPTPQWKRYYADFNLLNDPNVSTSITVSDPYLYLYIVSTEVNSNSGCYGSYVFVDDIRIEEEDVKLQITTTPSDTTPCISSTNNAYSIHYEVCLEAGSNPQTSDIVLALDFDNLPVNVHGSSDFTNVGGTWTTTIPSSFGLTETNCKDLYLYFGLPNDNPSSPTMVGKCFEPRIYVTSGGCSGSKAEAKVELCPGVPNALEISKVAKPKSGTAEDCFLFADDVTYDITIKNVSPYTIKNIIIKDQFPANAVAGVTAVDFILPAINGTMYSLPLPELQPGATYTYPFTFSIDQNPITSITINNCASVYKAIGACELPEPVCEQVFIRWNNSSYPETFEYSHVCDGDEFLVDFFGPDCFYGWDWKFTRIAPLPIYEVGTASSQDVNDLRLSPGTYVIRVTVLDKNGNYISFEETIELERPSANITGPLTACNYDNPDTYSLNSISPSSGANTYCWSVFSLNSNHTFTGTLCGSSNTSISVTWGDGLGGTVSCTITDEFGCSGTVYLNVSPCCPDLRIEGDPTDCAQCVVSYYELDNPVPGISYIWTVTGSSNIPSTPFTTPPADYIQNICWDPLASDKKIIISSTVCPAETLAIYPCCKNPSASFINDTSITAVFARQGNRQVPIVTSSGGANPTFTIQGNQAPIYINGTLTIDEDLIIKDHKNILLAPSARIRVLNDVTLTIQGSNLRAGCNEMWEGIVLGSRGHLIVRPGTGNAGSLIRDAKKAVLSQNATVASFELQNSNLSHNRHHVVVENFVGTLTRPYDAVIDHTNFTCPSNLLPPHNVTPGRTDIAIVLNDVTDINIGHFVSASNSSVNIFSNTTSGITAQRSSANIRGNIFGNAFLNGTVPFGIVAANGRVSNPLNRRDFIGATGNLFIFTNNGMTIFSYPYATITNNTILNHSSLGRAIQVLRAPSSIVPRVTIEGNNIYNGTLGISLFDIGVKMSVKTNRIYFQPNLPGIANSTAAHTQGIYVGSSLGNFFFKNDFYQNLVEDAHTGITIQNTSRNNVVENHVVELRDPGVSADYNTGIYLINSNSNWVYRNNVSGTTRLTNDRQYGITNFHGNSSSIHCNDLTLLGNALYNRAANNNYTKYIRNDMINVNYGIHLHTGYIVSQGSATRSFDNAWFSTAPAAHIGTTSCPDCVNTIFYMRDQAPGNVFHPDPFNNVNAALSTKVTIDEITPTSEDDACPVVSSLEIPDREFDMDVANAKKIAQDSISFSVDSITTRWWARRGLYLSLLNNDSLVKAEPVLTSFRAGYDASAAGKLDNLKTSINGFTQKQFNEDVFDELKTKIQDITTDHSIDSVTRSYMLNLLDHVRWPDSAAILANIESVADLCLFYSGPSVSEARALLISDSLDLLTQDWETGCNVIYKRGNEIEKENISISSEKNVPYYMLYPNMLQGDKNVTLLMPKDENGIIEFYGALGNPIVSYRVQEGSNNFNLNNFAVTGLLFYKVKVKGATKTEGKIIVVN